MKNKDEAGVLVDVSAGWERVAFDYDALAAATLAGQQPREEPKIQEDPKPQDGPAVIPPF